MEQPGASAGLDEDSALTARARQGDTAAFDQLYRTYRNQLYTFCLNVCGDREEAADLLQDAFIRAWRGLAKFGGRASFRTWLYRIALNVCRDAAQQRKRVRQVQAAAPAESDQGIGEVRAVLAQLRPAFREVLVLRYSQSLSYREIADRLDWSLSRVKVTLYRARHAFKNAYLRANEDLP